MSRPAVTVVGVGADGCASLPSRSINAVSRANVLVGSRRQLAFFREFRGQIVEVEGGLTAAIEQVRVLSEDNNVCVLASGDPMFYGIGALVVRAVGAEHVEVLPQPSAVQWAFSRVGLKWDDATFLSLHGRAMDGLVTRLRTASKVACLTDPENSPGRIAARMVEYGETAWRAWVCENLGGADERVREFAVESLAHVHEFAELNTLVLARTDAAWRRPPAIPFMHEDAFAKRMPKRGLITKREVRALVLASLHIRPDSVVWDIGAGSGSVAIEAAMVAPAGRVYAVEVDPAGVEICRENVRAHGVDNVHVVAGRAPAALAELPDPDAVFIGGSKGSMDFIVDTAVSRMKPGGRLVITAITLENVHEAYTALRGRELQPEISLLNLSRAVPLARYFRYEALNPIHIFAATTP